MPQKPTIEPEPFDAQAYAGQMAAALALPFDDARQIEANLTVAFRMASLFLDFPLPDDAEPAAIFAADQSAP